MNKSFIYDDQLSDLSFYNNESLPCIFLREDDNYFVLLNAYDALRTDDDVLDTAYCTVSSTY